MTMIIEELVSNILETKFETFSDEVVEDAKKRFIDVIGCAIGGANASGNSIMLDLVRGWDGKKEATILVHGDRVPALNAAMMNCIMCRSLDYESCGPGEGEVPGRGGNPREWRALFDLSRHLVSRVVASVREERQGDGNGQAGSPLALGGGQGLCPHGLDRLPHARSRQPDVLRVGAGGIHTGGRAADLL